MDLQLLAGSQAGVVSRAQVLASGRTDSWMHAQLAAERWRAVRPGVYAVGAGVLDRAGERWAAVLACGSGAALASTTALEVDGVLPVGTRIVVHVPLRRHIEAPPGIVVRRSARLETARHPLALPPRTRVEESVLDALADCVTPAAVVDLLSRACQCRRTTARRLLEHAAGRPRLPWRPLLLDVLADVAVGAETPLERRYLIDVERRHGLPKGERQQRVRHGLRTLWRDVDYPEYRLVVELDGAATRPQHLAFRDYARDNLASLRQEWSARYGWHDVAGRPCAVAAQVAQLLTDRGWIGRPVACGPSCPVAA